MSTATTWYPLATNFLTVAAPMPLAAPLINATFVPVTIASSSQPHDVPGFGGRRDRPPKRSRHLDGFANQLVRRRGLTDMVEGVIFGAHAYVVALQNRRGQDIDLPLAHHADRD